MPPGRRVRILGVVCVVGACVTGDASAAQERRVETPRRSAGQARVPSKAAFAIRVGELRVPLKVLAVGVPPRGVVELAPARDANVSLAIEGGAGQLRRNGPNRWRWTAPAAPGTHTLRVMNRARTDTIHVTFLVLRPASDVRDGDLNGYPIGSYRRRPASMTAAYEPPRGFIEATPADHDILVSPNFTLGQFLCKQPGDPRYVLVSPGLLMKLEAILGAVNDAGYATPSLTVMSGFRTPAYNRAIGNTTDFSRHLWGDAADIYVDVDGDGDMDDLDGDGRSGIGDARWLSAIVDGLMRTTAAGLAPGGLSVYRRNAVHGPFVHVDTRGHRARW